MKAILIILIPFLGMKVELPAAHFGLMQSVTTDSTASGWKQSLAKFRSVLLTRDKKTVKTFFEFPILNPGNDIWLVADMQYATKLNSKNIVPFQESDFDKYYASILSMDFRKTLEQIDIEKLARDKMTETAELIVVSPATSKMRAEYSEAESTIRLSLITKSPQFGQFTIDYHFKILTSGDIRFTHVKFIL